MDSRDRSEHVLRGIETRLRALAEACAEQTEILVALRHAAEASTVELLANHLELAAPGADER